MGNYNWIMGYLIIKYRINITVYALHSYSNTASIIGCNVRGKYTKRRGQKKRISSIYAFNFETKSILSDKAWVDLESLSIFFLFFLGFSYETTEKL